MTQANLSSAQVDQLRRDAKRLARSSDITYSQALDKLAAEKGFRNWSLLVRSAESISDSSDPFGAFKVYDSVETPSTDVGPYVSRVTGLRMDASRSETATIAAIVKRLGEVLGKDHRLDRLSLMMDLEACHCNGCPLDLISLHEVSRDADLVHDVLGIRTHLNRETGKLEDFFWPRYAMPEVKQSA